MKKGERVQEALYRFIVGMSDLGVDPQNVTVLLPHSDFYKVLLAMAAADNDAGLGCRSHDRYDHDYCFMSIKFAVEDLAVLRKKVRYLEQQVENLERQIRAVRYVT